MAGMPRTKALIGLGALTFCSPLAAQDAWLGEVPTASQVAQGLIVPSLRETAARRVAALYAMENLVGSLAGASPSAQAQARVAALRGMQRQVYEAEKQRDPTPYLLERCSQAYSESPAFQRELLDLFFTPGWQAAYGAGLDPRRWKAPLALAPGTKVTAASLNPTMVEECGGTVPQAVAVTPRAASAAAPGADPVEQKRAEARAMLQAGDTGRALDAYQRIALAYPARYEGFVGLGLIYVAQHQYALALPAWQKVVELAPTDAFSLYMVGASYANLRRYEEAREVLRRVTRMKAGPDVLVPAHFTLGVTCIRLGQREGAIESYRVLATLDTTYANKLAAQLNAPSRQGATPPPVNPAGTGAAPPTAAAARPAVPNARVEALRAEGRQYYKVEAYQKARGSFEKLLTLDPDDAWGLYELGKSLLMIEGSSDTDSMLVVWKRAVVLEPSDTELLLELGDALYTWDPAAADAAFERALAIAPDDVTRARAHAGMGWASYFYLNYPSALAELMKANRLDPKNDEYVYGIGLIYARDGNKAAARAVFRQLTTRNQKMAQELMAEINKKEQ